MRLGIHPRIAEVAADDWNALGVDAPFLRHEFLHTLEAAGCVGAATGWLPQHVTVRDGTGRLLAALPCYLKTHSYGEFVFDWAWADAAARVGLAYFPKLVAAVPFTPVTCAKPLLAADADRTAVAAFLAEGLRTHADALGASSAHVLHLVEPALAGWHGGGYVARASTRYRWRDRGYGDYEGFLAALTRERRKKARQEWRHVRDAGIELLWVDGHALAGDPALLDVVYRCYAMTYEERDQTPYLTRDFWARLAAAAPTALAVALARRAGGRIVAAALCLRDATTLYGRHWGALESHRDLHFVLCYQAGIAHCLASGLRHFDPGIQGEHKVWRGFEPSLSWSAHWLAAPALHAAVAEFCARERRVIEHQVAALSRHLPFRPPTEPAP